MARCPKQLSPLPASRQDAGSQWTSCTLSFSTSSCNASDLKVSVRKYVDDMVLAASGRGCAFDLREAFKAVRTVLSNAGMMLNKMKCVVVADTDASLAGTNAGELGVVWECRILQVAFHTRGLGVDVQWGPWRNPVQQSRIKSFTAAMTRVRMLNLPLRFKMSMIRALYPLVIYGSEVSGLAVTSLQKVRVSARRALGRGAQLRRAAELELALKGGIKADPQVTLDLYTIRAWQRALQAGQLWPPAETQWADASKGRRGRGPVRHLHSLCERLGWYPKPGGFGPTSQRCGPSHF
eukprot:2620887-Amphidinium_carterae.1